MQDNKSFLQHSKIDSPLGQANYRERFWIWVLKSKMPNGYNRTNGGECGIHKPLISSLNKKVGVVTIGDNKSSPKAWAFITGTYQRCGRF